MPDDKVVYIVNIMENLDSLFNGTEPDEEKMQAYDNLKKYRRPACTSNLLKISRKGC